MLLEGKKVNVRRMSTIGPPPPSVTPKKRSDSTASEFLNRNDRILSKTPGGYGADSKHPKV